MKTLYQCNPELFERCKKTLCQEECTLTTFEKYAKRDEFGNPIIAMDDNMSVAVDKALEQEQKTGNWEWVQYDSNPNIGNWHCSECNRIVCGAIKNAANPIFYAYNYCPNCGARMAESEDKE